MAGSFDLPPDRAGISTSVCSTVHPEENTKHTEPSHWRPSFSDGGK